MEIEYKWDWPATLSETELLAATCIAPHVTGTQTVKLHARYFDTASGLVRKRHAALRLRTENERSVCCLKTPAGNTGGCTARQEFEVEAPSIRAGLEALRAGGAPAELLDELLASELHVTCETEFTRHAMTLAFPETCAELALDDGRLGHDGIWVPLHEIELEHKGGSLDAFTRVADALATAFNLRPQPLSKLARALGA